MRRGAIVLALSLSLTGCGYNRIQELDERVEQMKANVQTELVRRADLIPNLVATVDEVARFEQETFTQVAQARAGLSQSSDRVRQAAEQGADTEQLAAADAELTRNMRNFINISVEAYPQLRANENFIRLQDELTETENRLAVSRRDYNESVQAYNTYIRRFPQTLTARVIGAERKETYEAPAGAQEAPQVQFDRTP